MKIRWVAKTLYGCRMFLQRALKTTDKIGILAGMVKHVISFSNTVRLREHKELVRACRKKLQILGEKKA
jgi:hypothetical protein